MRIVTFSVTYKSELSSTGYQLPVCNVNIFECLLQKTKANASKDGHRYGFVDGYVQAHDTAGGLEDDG
jgi:hypothetical protein